MWVLDHLSAVESDFSHFHRVDDIYSMESPRFFRLLKHLIDLPGSVQAAAVREHQQEEESTGKKSSLKSGVRKNQDANDRAISALAFEVVQEPPAVGRR